MVVTRESLERVEVIAKRIGEKSFYQARLFEFVGEAPRHSSPDREKEAPSYIFDMYLTPDEKEFADDLQAKNFFENNFDEEFRIAKRVETIRLLAEEKTEAKQALASFDYVVIKMDEAAYVELKKLYEAKQRGEEVSFEQFLDAFVPRLLEIEKGKGKNFFSYRDAQRAVANGITPSER